MDLIKNTRLTTPTVIEQMTTGAAGMHERFMVTWCPEVRLESYEDTYYHNLRELKKIFSDSRKWKIEGEFHVEYGATDRLHFHIIIICRTKSSSYSFNRCIWHKLKKLGFLKKSNYHSGLAEYLTKEKAFLEIEKPLIRPLTFSSEFLERYDARA